MGSADIMKLADSIGEQVGNPPAARNTRELVLVTALRLFSSQPYDKVSMRMLALEIGINPATLYHHFKDKRGLYRETLETFYRDFSDPFADILSVAQDPREKLKAYIRGFCMLVDRNPELINLIKREQVNGDLEQLSTLHQGVLSSQITAVVDLIKTVLPGHDPVLTMAVLHGAPLFHYDALSGQGLISNWTEQRSEPDKLADYLIRLFGL